MSDSGRRSGNYDDGPSFLELLGVMPDPTAEAVVSHDDMLDTLERIASNTASLASPSYDSVWQPVSAQLAPGAGEVSLLANERVRFLYVPNVPRTMTVYAGGFRDLFLARLGVGQTLQVELPYPTNGLYIEYDAGTGEVVNAYLSARAITIAIRSGIVSQRLQALSAELAPGASTIVAENRNRKRIVVRASSGTLTIFDVSGLRIGLATATSEWITNAMTSFSVQNSSASAATALIYEEV